MLPSSKGAQIKSRIEENNLLSSFPAHSMPILPLKPSKIPTATKPFESQKSFNQLKQKTTAETISETKRMLSNGKFFFNQHKISSTNTVEEKIQKKNLFQLTFYV